MLKILSAQSLRRAIWLAMLLAALTSQSVVIPPLAALAQSGPQEISVVGEAPDAAPPGSTMGQFDIVPPAGSEDFGRNVLALPNGNIVVCDSKYDDGATADVGAAFLYNGATLTLMTTLKGSQSGDQVCSGGLTTVNGNKFVVISPKWDNSGAADAGAVTWVDGDIGLDDVVSSSNSLVGSTAGDQVGFTSVKVLPSGNYLVGSPLWDNSGAADAGAVTWVNGATGTPKNEAGTGAAVSSSNSIVGGSANDHAGQECIASSASCLGATVLSDGDYVVISREWDASGAATDVGAFTWGDGASGTSGVVSSANSLVGSTTGDGLGSFIEPLVGNGNYVVQMQEWDNGGTADVGAVTWCAGDGSCTGAVSTTTSLHGSTANDLVGRADALANGNYTVHSYQWDYTGVANDAGAVTWVNGTNGIPKGEGAKGAAVSVSNSLVGGTLQDKLGEGTNPVTALSNGNYVVLIPGWDMPGAPAVVDAGAVVWGDGTAGIAGLVSTANALHGSSPGDLTGSGVYPLIGNGNYVVVAKFWDNGTDVDTGAATWVDGGTGQPFGEAGPGAAISTANSLHGSTTGDSAGSSGVSLLSNGNYAVYSPLWDDGGTADVGAVTWSDGTTGIAGPVSTSNSLHGTTAGDNVGELAPLAPARLNNGNYVVPSPSWDNGGTVDAGAVTWVDGANGHPIGTGSPGAAVSTGNSLYGAVANFGAGQVDPLYATPVTALDDGNYVVTSDSGAGSPGAYTWGNGATGTSGPISASNSLYGTSFAVRPVFALPGGEYAVAAYFTTGNGMVAWSALSPGLTGAPAEPTSMFSSNPSLIVNPRTFSASLQQLAVGRPADNLVTVMYVAWPIDITFAGSGSGTVAAAPVQNHWPYTPSGASCTADCTINGRLNREVTLTATADPGSIFTGWSGGICSGTGTCVVTADAAKSVIATFDTPTAVTLASLDAEAQADHVLVTWETVSELQNSGFNLYRTVSADPPSAANLLAYVPSQGPGSAQGYFYSHQDYGVTSGQTYWYWLEDIDLYGYPTIHGPVSVVFVGPTAVTLNGLEAAQDQPLLAWPLLLATITTTLVIAGALTVRRAKA